LFANIFYNYSSNKISLWEYHDGNRFFVQEDYTPYCYIPNKNGKFKDLYGSRCKLKKFKNYHDQKEFVQNYNSYEGDITPIDRTLIDRYHDIDLLKTIPTLHIHITDIETKCDEGFPDAQRPNDEILLISTYSNKTKKVHIFGQYKFDFSKLSKDIQEKININDIIYTYCQSERELLKEYFRFHRSDYPDIISGWYSHIFDFPYILDRAILILGDKFASKYSPVGVIKESYHKDKKEYEIAGITICDYQDIYKKYSINERDSYSLNNIAHTELNEEKLEYDGTLRILWKTDWNLYTAYNIQDVLLVKKLDEKLDFIGLIQVQAYISKVPLNKVHSSIKKFDNYLMSLLKSSSIVLPTAKRRHSSNIPGGFVLEPTRKGYHQNAVSFDFTSLYPIIMMTLNLSPETFVGKITSVEGNTYRDIDYICLENDKEYMILNKIKKGSDIKKLIDKHKLILSPNGLLFKSGEGFIPKIVNNIFKNRKDFQKTMRDYDKKYEETKEEKYKRLAQKYNLYQHAQKITINAMYGILANPNFRLFDADFASAITLTGQKLIKYTIYNTNEFFKEKFKIDKDVVYFASTDSCYLDYDEILKKLKVNDENKIVNIINKINEKIIGPYFKEIFKVFSLDMMKSDKNLFEFEREFIIKTSIHIDKRKYAMLILDKEGTTYKEPKFVVKGIEIVRSSTPEYCRDKIKDIVMMILNMKEKSQVIDSLKNIHKDFIIQPPHIIAFPRGIKELTKYIDSKGNTNKGCPIHVRAAHNYNTLVEKLRLEVKYDYIMPGEKLKFLYLTPSKILHTQNVIAFPEILPEEFELHKFIDVETQFNKTFMSPINTITNSIGWGNLDLYTSDIDEFF